MHRLKDKTQKRFNKYNGHQQAKLNLVMLIWNSEN